MITEATSSGVEEIAASLAADIEKAKATSWFDLADKLGLDVGTLMSVCRTLSMNHGYEKLSSRSIYYYFQHWAAMAATQQQRALPEQSQEKMNEQ